MLKIDCVAQNYKWGKKGSTALVAKFKKSSDDAFSINEEENYAELWMGTHPSGPSKIQNTSTLLSEWLSDKANATGQVPAGYPNNNLPFLFKVLSVRTALSIQTHPNKTLAQKLHEQFPDIYKDANHKPEMVIALTDFECLCGFRTVTEVCQNFDKYPELEAVVNHSANIGVIFRAVTDLSAVSRSTLSSMLEQMFKSLMGCPHKLVSQQLDLLIARLKAAATTAATATATDSAGSSDDNSKGGEAVVETAAAAAAEGGVALSAVDALILRLFEQYGHDTGVFCPLIMNVIALQPGDSFFIGANILHAYIAGECVECMALSDNVVRAGLTPKFKDCDTLCAMLQYESKMPDFLSPLPLDRNTAVYRPPAESCAEFEVERIFIPAVPAAAVAPAVTTTPPVKVESTTGSSGNNFSGAAINTGAAGTNTGAGSAHVIPARPCGSILIMISGGGRYSLRLSMSSNSKPTSPTAAGDGTSSSGKKRSGSITSLLRRFTGGNSKNNSNSSSSSSNNNSSSSGGGTGKNKGKPDAVDEASMQLLTSSVDLLVDGSVVFIPAGVETVLTATADAAAAAVEDAQTDAGSDVPAVLYRAHVNLGGTA